jgi:glycosyltransferase involved in cell wall biosynthesis
MKVLMLGWEFPPFISGGLGTACFGLTKAMSQLGNVDVTFVLPQPIRSAFSTHVRLLAPDAMPVATRSAALTEAQETETAWSLEGINNVTFRSAAVEGFSVYAKPARLQRRTATNQPRVARFRVVEPGQSTEQPQPQQQTVQPAAKGQPQSFVAGSGDIYGDMYRSVDNYRNIVLEIAAEEDFDVIHAHDWMTYLAGIAAAAVTGKPLVVHVHSTEFDRSGLHVNQWIYDIERAGMHAADRVVAVSHLTKSMCISRYGVPGDKVEVVYNAVEMNGMSSRNGNRLPAAIGREEKIVLFLGRVTMQKGPDYFLSAARKVLDVMPNVRFIMAGSGDMIRRTVEMAVNMGIGHKVLFTGFLRGDDVAKVFKMADVYVMPSVSEPFGIAPLEALSHDVPTIISKQSGVSEVLTHVLKVDFWDVDEIANKIIAVLRHPPLRETLKQYSGLELRKFSWLDSARQCVKVYEEASCQHAVVH